MISAILIFMENGTMLADALFEKLQMDSILIAGFTTAINQFGLKIFPENQEELEDIVFTKHHILFQKFKLQDQAVLFLTVHDKYDDHVILKKINQEIFWEFKQKFSHAFVKDMIEIKQFRPILDRIEAIFLSNHRKEKLVR